MRFKLWASNIATAIIVCLLTSAFWIIAYSNAGDGEDVEAAGDTAVVKTERGGEVEIAEGLVVGPTGLAIPVAGVKPNQLVDTYTQARAGGARVHDAIDIMADQGTPVVAAAPGTVEKLFFSDGGGGITVYVRSPDKRWMYYYAHLAGYAPGLREGQQVKRGTPIGRVGSTGNANPEGPHLHFAIHRMQPGDGWWEGSAINPYPLLAGEG
ncbi:M23 family metallopeptidase [Sphingosinicella humi]|uniref:Peptidase M23 n=1 Tax=Allosphingosinicella humi TaxID=2068657 RepID=A0A2U2J524_9SPHN|nr:M23 family metallopeptidase [Sphingosinicella humi]PWG03381.1 peptidase M23 [Sphingosinicella humi]